MKLCFWTNSGTVYIGLSVQKERRRKLCWHWFSFRGEKPRRKGCRSILFSVHERSVDSSSNTPLWAASILEWILSAPWKVSSAKTGYQNSPNFTATMFWQSTGCIWCKFMDLKQCFDVQSSGVAWDAFTPKLCLFFVVHCNQINSLTSHKRIFCARVRCRVYFTSVCDGFRGEQLGNVDLQPKKFFFFLHLWNEFESKKTC